MVNPEGEIGFGNPIIDTYNLLPQKFSEVYNEAKLRGDIDGIKQFDDEIARYETPIQKIIRLRVTNGRSSYSPILVSRKSRIKLYPDLSEEEGDKCSLSSWFSNAKEPWGYLETELEIFKLLRPNVLLS